MRPPLFIICPGRSFSSVISAVIGQHPDAFGLPEVNLFRKETVQELYDAESRVFSRQANTAGLKRTVAELQFGGQTVETIEQAEAWIAARKTAPGAQVFRELQALAGDRMLVEKSPSNTHASALARIEAAFPEAFFLHITRHPRATCRSQHKAFAQRGRRAVTDFDHAAHWVERHANCISLGTRVPPGQYMSLYGEWFFPDPKRLLRQICEWLDLSTADAALDEMMHPERGPFSRPGPENAKGGNNKGFLENPHLRVGDIKPETLEGPLDWGPEDSAGFDVLTRTLAHQLGYVDAPR